MTSSLKMAFLFRGLELRLDCCVEWRDGLVHALSLTHSGLLLLLLESLSPDSSELESERPNAADRETTTIPGNSIYSMHSQLLLASHKIATN